jgi:hypothetical protein
MAETTEQTSPDHNPSEPTDAPQAPAGPSVMVKLTGLLNQGKLDAVSWFIRIYLVFLSIQHILLGGALPSIDPCYKKALIANALVACIRLHQRIGGNFALNKEHFARVALEDSAHYLLFSLVFLMQPGKITMALVPITIMAAIHAVKYSYKVLDTIGTNTGRGLLNSIALKQQSLFRIVALTEIFLLPVLIIMVFLGRAQIFSPFLYYRYVKLRYHSQRNKYCQQVFYELRMTGDMYKNKAGTPAILKKAIQSCQDLCLKFSAQ